MSSGDWIARSGGPRGQIGDPHLALIATIHIGGTNGKGSVTSTVGFDPRSPGRTQDVGLLHVALTSAPFASGCSSIGSPLSDETLLAYVASTCFEPVLRDLVMTFFEAASRFSPSYTFARESEVDVAVHGGRPRRAARLRRTSYWLEVSAVTNVAMDHAGLPR